MIVYLDTSSLAKLYLEEPGTPEVRALVVKARIVATSDVAYPEMRAALTRRHRDRSLSRARFQTATRSFEADWNSYLAVATTGNRYTPPCGARQGARALHGMDDQREAGSEGWDLFECGGDHAPFELERIDEMAVFADDAAAWKHVIAKVKVGSPLHCRAMAFLFENSPDEYYEVMKHY